MHSKFKNIPNANSSTKLTEKRLQRGLDKNKNSSICPDSVSLAKKNESQLNLQCNIQKTREEKFKTVVNNMRNPFAPIPNSDKLSPFINENREVNYVTSSEKIEELSEGESKAAIIHLPSLRTRA